MNIPRQDFVINPYKKRNEPPRIASWCRPLETGKKYFPDILVPVDIVIIKGFFLLNCPMFLEGGSTRIQIVAWSAYTVVS